MNNFNITDERILDYRDGNKLYLMQIKFKNNYYIVVDSRSKRVAKKRVNSEKEGDVVFAQIERRLQEFADISIAHEIIEIAFSMDTVREQMFLINNLKREVDFTSIWKMKKTYGCETTPVLTDMIFEDTKYNNTIYVTFPGHKIPLGYFKAADKDLNFRFELNLEFFFP